MLENLLLLTVAASAATRFPAAVEPQGLTLSTEAARALARVEDGLRMTPTGKRLLAETAGVARRQFHLFDAGVKARAKTLAVDHARLRAAPVWHSELGLARELARVAHGLPAALREAEAAAGREAAVFAAERSLAEPEFSRALRGAFEAMRRRHEAERVLDPSFRALALPLDEMERAAYLLYLLILDPHAFLWACEVQAGPRTYSFSQAQDLQDLYAKPLAAVSIQPGAVYAELGGRRYPAELVRLAQDLLDSGARQRVRDALAKLEERELLGLQKKLKRWADGKGL